MKTVARRLDRLQDRLVPQGRKQFLIVVTDAAQKLALDSDSCVQILREAGGASIQRTRLASWI